MTLVIIIAVCVVLLVLAFLVPRLSRHPQRGVDRTLASGQGAASKAPGRLGRWLPKGFRLSRRATNASARKGREARRKMPT